MIGYKVFNKDFTCREFQFSENTEFKHEGDIEVCQSGFHFCLKAIDCFSYYNFNSDNIVCEVEALGKTLTHYEDSKICTDHIRIGKRLSWHEVLELVNTGKNNTGYENSGDENSGNRNSGYRNSGDGNSGDGNSGDGNSGNRNSGDGNSGVFCTHGYDRSIEMFNKPSTWSYEKWYNSNARTLFMNIEVSLFVPSNIMTDQEKLDNPKYETIEGYIKTIPFKEAFQNAWHNWTQENRNEFLNLPNFDKDIFFEISGIKID